MNNIAFDRLNYVETLKSAGIPEAQARAHAHALDDAMRDSVATRSDITSLRTEIEMFKRDIIIAVGSMMIGLGAFLTALQFFVK
jgi:hypothetical protein